MNSMTNIFDHEQYDVQDHDVELKGGSGVQLTQGLFLEWGNPDAHYTLKNRDIEKNGKQYISMYKVYMASVDEYEAAEKLLGSQAHWKKLCNQSWFLNGELRLGHEGLQGWREDMEKRDRSSAKRKLIEAAEAGNVNAAKVLYGPQSTKKKEPKKQPEEGETTFEGFAKSQSNKPTLQS